MKMYIKCLYKPLGHSPSKQSTCVYVCVWGGGGWKELRELQRGWAGLHLVRHRAVRDLSGCLCTGRDIVLQGWHQHFQGVLNVQSSYDIHAIEEAEDYPLRSELADPPIEEELVEALRKMKVGKAR